MSKCETFGYTGLFSLHIECPSYIILVAIAPEYLAGNNAFHTESYIISIFNKFKLNRFSDSNHLDESVLKFRGCLWIFIIQSNSKRSRTLFKIGVKTLIRGCTTSDLGLHC